MDSVEKAVNRLFTETNEEFWDLFLTAQEHTDRDTIEALFRAIIQEVGEA